MSTKAKTAQPQTLRTRLTRLDYAQACKLLGHDAKRLVARGAKYDDIDIDRDVFLRGDLLRLTLRDAADDGSDVRVTLTLMASKQKRLAFNCDHCETTCEHVGAAFSLVLDEKYALGLSEIPKEGVPIELLSEAELEQRALAERAKRAKDEAFRLRSSDPTQPWTDYAISSLQSGRTYRVALRGEERGQSYCSCPDFRSNKLGTCKHVIYALRRVQQKFTAEERACPFQPEDFAVHLNYGEDLTLCMETPPRIPKRLKSVVKPYLVGPIDDVHGLVAAIAKIQSAGCEVLVYPDAEEWIQHQLHQDRVDSLVKQIRGNPAKHPLRTGLLRTELLPYQLDGIAFAVKAGRAVLADDMGLGKTIQGIGVAELLAQHAGISRALVVCPTSLKSQWRNEIRRFAQRDAQLILGTAEERWGQYDNDCFFTICNYEQVLRDIQAIEQVGWDLIILDEGQRIKNWASKTSRVIKGLKSPFALVLSGTPLENRLDELYSVVQFIDDRRLDPAFRFFHRHRVVDERGKVTGYKNLDVLRERLKPILLRRTRDSVLQQLPERNTEIVRIPPTAEQKRISDQNISIAAQIAAKKFITEMDLLRIQKALATARMAADSTFLVDKKKPGFSTKLEYLEELIGQLAIDRGRKTVLFSEWTKMLDLIEPIVAKFGIEYVRLDGSVPQKKRQQLVSRFQADDDCRMFLTSNAGSTGLNLQAANTVINVDLPWNPAVLEQRISRAHRMGQRRPVDVYLLVTEQTIEERMLQTLADKQNLAIAALDIESDVEQVDFQSGMEQLKQRLEILLGSKPIAPEDRSSRQKVEQELEQFAVHRERVAAAGGEMLGAVFAFLGELVEDGPAVAPAAEKVAVVRERLAACSSEDQTGRQQLTFTLPDRQALDRLAVTLARLVVAGEDEQVER